MTERPIIFSAPMVRALLAGTKTQTRRVLKPQPPERVSCFEPHPSFPNELIPWRDGEPLHSHVVPYAPGDRLWVREAWARNANQISDTRMDASVMYRADGETRAQDNGVDLPWRPSIHMPRWASRLTLAVTGVKVERLQEISEADAKAEGAIRMVVDDEAKFYERDDGTFKCGFAGIWSHIHGLDSWDANQWVVAITFTVHKANIDAMEKAA